MRMDVALAVAWITAAAEAVTASADELTRLDSAIGDGDHGTNLTRGFTAVLAAIDGAAAESVGDILTRTGGTLISKVGGASGPLYGTAFRAMGRALPAAPSVDAAELATALRAGLDALRRLGGAAPGDKTMVDALAPAVDAFAATVATAPTPTVDTVARPGVETTATPTVDAQTAAAGDAVLARATAADDAVLAGATAAGDAVLARAAAAAADAAEEGMLATVDLVARKGRASYLGARSAGHQDPGATSAWLILRALAAVTAG